MKLIYITSYTFPSTRAEPYYIKSMAEAFAKNLGHNFSLMIRGVVPEEMKHMDTVSVKMPQRLRTLCYFFWFPVFVVRKRMNTKDVVFMSNDPYIAAIFVFWKKAFFLKYRICSDWHQLFDDWRDAFVARGSEYLVTTTKKLQNHLLTQCAVPLEKVLVAYGGIDLRFFDNKSHISKNALRGKLQLPVDAFLVGYIGGFKAVGLEKGLDTMIQALPHINESVCMVFVGGSDADIAEYTQRAEKMNLKHRCIFVRKQQFAQLTEYECAMDVLAIPYPDKPHFREYGFPMKVWEYMASGRPLVYSNLEIIAEVLHGKGTPFVPDDEKSFACAIESIRANRQSAEEIGRQNTHDIRAYTWDERVKKILNFIQIS